jgi:hypothetical protein
MEERMGEPKGMLPNTRIITIKMDIIILAILFLSCAKYNGKKEVFISKVTLFQAWIMLILHQVMNSHQRLDISKGY